MGEVSREDSKSSSIFHIPEFRLYIHCILVRRFHLFIYYFQWLMNDFLARGGFHGPFFACSRLEYSD